jgi:hypothetical protein
MKDAAGAAGSSASQAIAEDPEAVCPTASSFLSLQRFQGDVHKVCEILHNFFANIRTNILVLKYIANISPIMCKISQHRCR